MFEELESSTVKREEEILGFWKKEEIFKQSLENRKSGPLFSMYDGPPFATGLPHYGHLLAGIIKDVVPRYKTMKGFYVPRRFGWDCHGLPIEQEVEKTYNLTGALSIEEFGIAKFNEACRGIVLRYTAEWEKTVDRIGRWIDFSNDWKTMDPSFMETVWWVFKQLYESGLIYQGFKVMPYSAKLGTPLSNFEAGENYQDIDDPSIIVTFPLEEDPLVSLLAWTTTPWTTISNLAVMVSPLIEYAEVEEVATGKRFIVAKNVIDKVFNENYSFLREFKGSELIGKRYIPLFDYFLSKKKEGAFRVIEEESVSAEEGTGIVHSAPAFGEVDFYAAKRAGIPLVMPIDRNGRFTKEIPEHADLFVKEADKAIIRRLKEKGRLFSQATFHHRYPFCWRSDTPLIYRAVDTWFVAVEKIKEELIAANKKTHWTPAHIKEGRFGNWLEGARDWAISRNRYWGTPLPIWKSNDGEIHVVGSLAELEELTGKKVADLHRQFIDPLTFEKNGKTFKRISEVFDCWFDAGSMPYAQNHYPFENKQQTERHHPADFIAEGIDQTRGWFYTLMVLSVALFNKPAFKNVITNGIILAEDGNKMSKRLKNYPEPKLVLNKYGADAIRLYLLHSPAVKAEDLRFSERGVELCLRQILIPLTHAHSFFTLYARIYGWTPPARWQEPEAVIDKWILSTLHQLIERVERGMDHYDLSLAVEPFVTFIDQLTNWYIRRNRRRFWADADTPDRQQAFETLYRVLLALAQISAPFIPFLSEAIYRNMRTADMPPSVHLSDFPTYDPLLRNPLLEEEMEALQTVVSLGHSLRKEYKLKVRQPLPAVHIVSTNPRILPFLDDQQHLIAEELNVKQVHFHKEKRDFVSHTIKPNFRILGKKVGRRMKETTQLIAQFDEEQIQQLLDGKSVTISPEGEPFDLILEDVEIGHSVEEGRVATNLGTLTVALDTTLNDALIYEGIARELVNKINTMRRDAGFAVTDRIKIYLQTSEKVLEAIHLHRDYIAEEVLALELNLEPHSQAFSWDINGEPTKIAIVKV